MVARNVCWLRCGLLSVLPRLGQPCAPRPAPRALPRAPASRILLGMGCRASECWLAPGGRVLLQLLPLSASASRAPRLAARSPRPRPRPRAPQPTPRAPRLHLAVCWAGAAEPLSVGWRLERESCVSCCRFLRPRRTLQTLRPAPCAPCPRSASRAPRLAPSRSPVCPPAR